VFLEGKRKGRESGVKKEGLCSREQIGVKMKTKNGTEEQTFSQIISVQSDIKRRLQEYEYTHS
jgi:hypothetical protein